MILSVTIIILLALIGYNIIPLINRLLEWTYEYTFLMDFMVINPLVALVCGIIFGLIHGFRIWGVLLIGILYLPTVFIFYNSSALIYTLLYLLAALIGCTLGAFIHQRRNNKYRIEQSIRRHKNY